MSLPLAPVATLDGISRLKRPNVTSVLVTAVAGMACVNEMNTSGVGVGGSITGTGVSSAVGTPASGVILNVMPQASDTTASIESASRNFLTAGMYMVAYPFVLDPI
jgi:hypothetical protein